MTDSLSDSTSGLVLMVPCGAPPPAALSHALAQANYGLHCVADISDVAAIAQTLQPDVVVVVTPHFSTPAATLCQTLKAQSHTRLLPIVVIGSDTDLAPRLRAFDCGAADYIHPDLDCREVVARLRVHITTSALQRRLQLQAQRAVVSGSSNTLLTDLQRALRRQAELLQAQNHQLQREVQEREQAQQALRLEKQKSEQLLLNILPKAIVEQLKQLQGSLAERFDDVTILFADIVNFTPWPPKPAPRPG